MGDVRNPVAAQWQPTAYRPFAQTPSISALLMVRASVADPLSLAPSVRRELHAIDATAPEFRIVARLDAAVLDYVSGERFTTSRLKSRTPTIFFDREGEPSPFSKFPTKVSASVQNGRTLDRKFRWLALDFHLRYPRGGLRRAFPSCYPVRERT